jgi:hypothetical protein
MSMDEAGSSYLDDEAFFAIRTKYVAVYDRWESANSVFGFVDLFRCEWLRSNALSGSIGTAHLYRSPRGNYIEYMTWVVTLPHTENGAQTVQECALFVHPRRAAKWFSLSPENAPEDLRPLVPEWKGPESGSLSFQFPSMVLYLEGDENLPGKLGKAIAVARKAKEENRICTFEDYRLDRARRGDHARSVVTRNLGRWRLLKERVSLDSRDNNTFKHESLY